MNKKKKTKKKRVKPAYLMDLNLEYGRRIGAVLDEAKDELHPVEFVEFILVVTKTLSTLLKKSV